MPEEYLDLYPNITDSDRHYYLAMVSHIDNGVTRVMEALEETGMENNTLIVYMADVSLKRSSIWFIALCHT